MSEKTVKIKVETLQTIFDALCHSMDFGSGFLDTDEVTRLREVAVILGVDPMVATPHEFAKHIKHPFHQPNKPWVSATTGQPVRLGCYHCSKWAEDAIHEEAS